MQGFEEITLCFTFFDFGTREFIKNVEKIGNREAKIGSG